MASRLPRLAVLGAGLVCAVPLYALDPAKDISQYSLDAWSTREGLPQSSVQAVLQTRDGYLWVATQEGLVRFDGVSFQVFDSSNTEAMTSNHVSALLESRDGSLWVGTVGGGLLRMKAGVVEAVRAPAGLPRDSITALAEDAQGGIWAGSTGSGASRFFAGRFADYTSQEGLAGDQVHSLLADADGSVWIGTRSGLCRYASGRFTSYGSAEGLADPTVAAVIRDHAGRLWVGTPAGVQRLGDDGRFAAGTLGPGNVRCLREDRHGGLWIGSAHGLHRLREGRSESLTGARGVGGDAVTCLLEDREGSLWVGTEGGGLGRLKDGKLVSYTTRQGLSTDNVYAVAGARGGGLWVGTYGSGVSLFRDGRFTSLPGQAPLLGVRLRTLLEDSRGVLWIGTDRGLFRQERGGLRRYTAAEGAPDDAVRTLYEDRQGRLWIGTGAKGLACLAGGVFRTFTREDGLGSNEVRTVLEDSQGTLWVGTYGGLSRLEGDRFRTYGAADGLPSPLVRSLHEDGGGGLWIGTYGGGLALLREGRFHSFRKRDGLLSDVVYQILEDSHHNLWMSCNRGVFRAALSSLEAFAAGKAARVPVVAYGESDGMANRECNGGSPGGWRTPDGRMWFPTLGGVVMADPDHLPRNPDAPPVLVESVLADGRPVSAGDALPPGSNRFEFRYTALSFTAPLEVRFKYKLEGIDANWVDAGPKRAAYYTHLPPGRYTFRVSAANEDGVWNSTGASFAFSRRPHFYETGWFYGGALVLLAATGGGFHRWRIRKHERMEEQLEARVQDGLARIKVLSGLLPICAWCKKVRDDGGYWSQLETYVAEHSEADFTHGICPECLARYYPQVAKARGTGSRPE
jgi:ligand-binding sensor domain-containing protein